MKSHAEPVGKTTRVNGKGLWRSWKRNFKNKLQALLDLIDNSLDAAIQAGDEDHSVGRVHVYPDIYEVLEGDKRASATTTGLCIINNCMKRIRPLEKVLEVYDSSKIDSGAGDIGENGVGLKQGCATLSDLSFVLVKNGSNRDIELGILAERLQREEGCYLPSFKFSNHKEDGSPTLRDQMISVFSQISNADVARCIAQYGAASAGSDPSLVVGVERLCNHFEHICNNFFNNSHVFLVIMDKVHHGLSEKYVKNTWDAQQKITVNRLMRDLSTEVPIHYLHIPTTFDFMIGGNKAAFFHWPERLVELASFVVDVNPKIPWQQKLATDLSASYKLRVFVGFDGTRITQPSASKEASLYVYSRQSGRLISHHPDARTLLGLSAGGTAFCQGLTVIIDDQGGNLPLNPTKQEVAFGEESHGEVHKENLFAAVGSVAHFFYSIHLKKFKEKKTVLTRKIAAFGDVLMQKHRHLKTLDSCELTTHQLSFKIVGKNIRVDKSSAKETIGADTLYRLTAERSKTVSDSKKRARQSPTSPTIPRRKRNRDTESESDGEEEELNDTDDSSLSAKHATQSSRRTKPVSYREPESEEENEEEEEEEEEEALGSEPGAGFHASIGERIMRRNAKNTAAEGEEMQEDRQAQSSANHSDHAEQTEESDTPQEDYRELCAALTDKLNSKKAKVKALKEELAQRTSELEKERDLRQNMQEQVKALQLKVKALER